MNTKELFQRSLNEIRDLRRTNEILRAKVDMIELFAGALYGQPGGRSGGAMSPDIAYELDKAIANIKDPEQP